MQILDVGETVPIVTAWYDTAGDGVEPTTVDLVITSPSGVVTTKTKADMTGSSSGSADAAPLDVWTYTLLVDAEGAWQAVATGTINTETVRQSHVLLVGEGSRAGGPFEPWCTWEQVVSMANGADLSKLDAAQREQLMDLATGIMWSLDGRRYPGIGQGVRQVCRSCSSCAQAFCCCTRRAAIDLGARWPVWGVWNVTIDGETLDPSAYVVRDHRYLERIDDESWPSCAMLTDADAFQVTWAYGRKPPVELSDACARFVAELAKGALNLKCEIPQRVTSITREGVSYTILDSQKFLDEGRVGIYLIDLALASAREGRKVQPGAFSPMHRTRTARLS